MTAPGNPFEFEHSNFNMLRIFAAVIVIYGNGLVLTGSPASGYWGAPVARIGLDIFFAISGYLAMTSWECTPRPKAYMIRRAVRMVPGLLACVLATIMVVGPLATRLPLRAYLLDPLTRHYLANVVLVQELWLPRAFEGQQWVGTVNPMLWTLVLGTLCCLTVPVFAMVPASARAWCVAACVALCALACAVLSWIDPQHAIQRGRISLLDMATEAPFFFVAVWLRMVTRHRGHLWRADLVMLCFAANWIVASWLGAWDLVLEWLTLPYMVACFGRMSLPVLGRLAMLGNPSYGLYLYAFPIQQLVVERLPGNPHPTLTCLLLTLPASFLSWHLVERPALRWEGPDGALWRLAGRQPLRGAL